jgi:The  BURPS668_1122 family of deaminases
LSNPTIQTNMPEISLKPSNKIFPSEVVENSVGQLFDRDVDSEYKILTEIASLLGDNLNATGTIKLFTERDVCKGCANVIQMFSNIYKSINIEIIHNNGEMLLP